LETDPSENSNKRQLNKEVSEDPVTKKLREVINIEDTCDDKPENGQGGLKKCDYLGLYGNRTASPKHSISPTKSSYSVNNSQKANNIKDFSVLKIVSSDEVEENSN
jgi:hypothetical protein